MFVYKWSDLGNTSHSTSSNHDEEEEEKELIKDNREIR